MQLSAVIPTYNYGALVARAAASALREAEVAEVIVVDDGSTDDTSERLAALARFDAAGRLRVVRQANAGPSAARNHGLRLARGEWVALLDADDYWYAGKSARQLAQLREYSGAVLAFAGVDVESSDGLRRRRLPPRAGPVSREALLVENVVPSPTVLVRRAAALAAGGFDEARRHGEDWELWLRLTETGPAVALREAWACYRDHANGLHRTPAMATGSHQVLAAALARRPAPRRVARAARAALHAADAFAAVEAGRLGPAAQAAAAALGADPATLGRLAWCAGYALARRRGLA